MSKNIPHHRNTIILPQLPQTPELRVEIHNSGNAFFVFLGNDQKPALTRVKFTDPNLSVEPEAQFIDTLFFQDKFTLAQQKVILHYLCSFEQSSEPAKKLLQYMPGVELDEIMRLRELQIDEYHASRMRITEQKQEDEIMRLRELWTDEYNASRMHITEQKQEFAPPQEVPYAPVDRPEDINGIKAYHLTLSNGTGRLVLCKGNILTTKDKITYDLYPHRDAAMGESYAFIRNVFLSGKFTPDEQSAMLEHVISYANAEVVEGLLYLQDKMVNVDDDKALGLEVFAKFMGEGYNLGDIETVRHGNLKFQFVPVLGEGRKLFTAVCIEQSGKFAIYNIPAMGNPIDGELLFSNFAEVIDQTDLDASQKEVLIKEIFAHCDGASDDLAGVAEYAASH